MPETIACPSCDGKLRIKEEMLGKKVKCPKCEKIFVAEVEEQKEAEELDEMEVLDERLAKKRRDEEDEDERGITDRPRARPSRRDDEDEDERPARRRSRDDEEDDRPRGRRRRDDDEEEEDDRPRRRSRDDDEEDEEDRPRNRKRDKKAGWKKVYQGLNLVVISMYVDLGYFAGIVLLLILIFTMGAALFAGGGFDPGAIFHGGVVLLLVGGLVGLVGFAGTVLSLVGYGFLLAIPSKRDSGAKPLAIATFSCYAAGAFFNLVGLVVGGASMLGLLANMGGFYCSLFLMRSIAFLCRDRGLAHAFISYLIATLAVGAGLVLLICIFSLVAGFSMANAGPGAAGGVGVGVIIMILLVIGVNIGLFVWKMLLTKQVHEAVASGYGRSIGLR